MLNREQFHRRRTEHLSVRSYRFPAKKIADQPNDVKDRRLARPIGTEQERQGPQINIEVDEGAVIADIDSFQHDS